eukprot:12012391-Ditylum_brightwellii.AAC.1
MSSLACLGSLGSFHVHSPGSLPVMSHPPVRLYPKPRIFVCDVTSSRSGMTSTLSSELSKQMTVSEVQPVTRKQQQCVCVNKCI